MLLTCKVSWMHILPMYKYIGKILSFYIYIYAFFEEKKYCTIAETSKKSLSSNSCFGSVPIVLTTDLQPEFERQVGNGKTASIGISEAISSPVIWLKKEIYTIMKEYFKMTIKTHNKNTTYHHSK